MDEEQLEQTQQKAGYPYPGECLRDYADVLGLNLGFAVSKETLKTYHDGILRHANIIAPLDGFGVKEWARSFEFLPDCRPIKYRAGNVIWHGHEDQMKWFPQFLNGDPQKFEAFLRATCQQRLDGARDAGINVVNEILDFNGKFAQNQAWQHFGDALPDRAFRIAREEMPGIDLYWSEHQLRSGSEFLGYGGKMPVWMGYCKRLAAEGLLDGVALQLHWDTLPFPRMRRLVEIVQEFQSYGLKVQFSEVSIWRERFVLPGMANELFQVTAFHEQRQAQSYGELIEIALENNVNTIILWTYGDAHPWHWTIDRIENCKPGIVDENGNPKGCYFTIRAALRKAIEAKGLEMPQYEGNLGAPDNS